MMYWREGLIAVLLALCAFLYNEGEEKVKENARLEAGLTAVKGQIKEIEVNHTQRIAEYGEAVKVKPKVVVKLQNVYIKETGDECNDLKNILDQYRSAISNGM